MIKFYRTIKRSVGSLPPVVTTAVLVIAVLLNTLGLEPTPANAANLNQFNPGNIMSDSVMSNKNTMSESDIQAFLLSKNPCNNTNIYLAQRYPHLRYTIRNGKFVCMAQDSFNGESASHIIWQAAQDYNINPQMIIVLLQKEQGLITDTWPNHVQYRSATGFGCPDTAACDAQYYGLKNQIRHAARLFREVLDGGWSNYPVGPNYIRYSPKAWCGGTTVNVQNRATSALYRYTPYQPNWSALNAGYGVGDACGAYGNRNFWLYFTDWFGSTTDVAWNRMSSPRWMRIKKAGVTKINLGNSEPIDGKLEQYRQIRFVDKIALNNITYLRTEWDSQHGLQKGIPITDLEEIPFEPIDNPRWMSITCHNTHKIFPTLGKAGGNIYPKGLVAHFTSKIMVNGVWYLRTESDTKAGNDVGFALDCIDTSNITNTLSFDKPRQLYVPAKSTFINLRDQTQNRTIDKATSMSFSKKFYFNGTWYYQTASDFNANRLIGVRGSLTQESVTFVAMDSPRELTLLRSTQKTDLADQKPVGYYIPKNTSRRFVDKYKLNNTWYLRTKSDYNNNLQLGIPIDLLH